MKKLLLTALAVASLGAAVPEPARADCLNESIASCNADFPGAGERVIGIRGWCYMIRLSWCALFDPSIT
jgi:hypothetical protein